MVSAKPWNLEAVARLLIGVFATFCFGIFAAGLLEGRKIGLAVEQVHFVELVILVTFFQGAALVWVAFFLRQSNISWVDAFGLRPPSLIKVIAAGLAMGLLTLSTLWLLQLCSEFIMERFGMHPVEQAAVQELQETGLKVWEKIVFALFTVGLAPLAEEVLFRGILYPTIKQLGYPKIALWGTSIAFGLMHFNAASLVPLIVLSLLLTFLYEATGSLLASVATHAMFNAANFVYLIFTDQINAALHLT